jgi:predicted ATP-grasp superfamily ATP-dependent carboligase
MHSGDIDMPLDALVLDARLRQSLVAVRSLGRRGLAACAVATVDEPPAFASRWCGARFVIEGQEGSSAYLAALLALLERTPARVLIASHDGTIALLRAHRAALERRLRLALASEPALAVAVNKERTLALAHRLGIGVPPQLVVRDPGEMPAALSEVGLPAVVKPSESWVQQGGQGSWLGPELVVTADESRRAVEAITQLGGEALVQRYLGGRREAVSLLYAKGEVHARFAQWARRTRPPLGGQSVLRQSIAMPPDIGAQAERLVREIDLEGYSEVEFRRDGSGVPYLMEINARLSASVEVAVRAGVDFPYLLHQWAAGERIDRVEGYRVGGWMRHLGGDIETTIDTLDQRGRPGVTPPLQTLLAFGLSFLRPMAYDYFDWRDPGPAVRASTEFSRGMIKRMDSRLRKAFS